MFTVVFKSKAVVMSVHSVASGWRWRQVIRMVADGGDEDGAPGFFSDLGRCGRGNEISKSAVVRPGPDGGGSSKAKALTEWAGLS